MSAERQYLPTLSDLVDRLSIVQLKAIRITGHNAEYKEEIRLIEHDIDLILREKNYLLTADDIRAVMMIMLANATIWDNEKIAREGGSEQDKLLKFTHSINGIRNAAKNRLGAAVGQRLDWKVDCFAAELEKQFGNWDVFG